MLKGLNEELALPLLQKRRMPDEPEVVNPLIADGVVCVTGAGGSVGSEIVLQVAAQQMHGSGRLILIDSSELNLYEINQTLVECAPNLTVKSFIADVRDEKAIVRLFQHTLPDVVFHAAALKHVPLLENDHNLIEAVLTNVWGTSVVLRAAAMISAHMVLISTDKAVNPSSVMGLTKRAAELTFLSTATSRLRAAIVRFGNVLGSSGSVVPLFKRQIAQGGPVTVTHPDMTRYMMTIRDAAELVVRAYVSEREGPTSHRSGLYVLDMGEPIRIMQLAEQMIRHSGLRPGKDIEIQITGIRPGEKLEEELFYPSETLVTNAPIGGLRVCRPTAPEDTETKVSHLLGAALARNVDRTKNTLLALVPEYTGAETWK